MHLKKIPHFTTLQKFFKRLPTAILQEINKIILANSEVNGEIVAMDGSGFTNDYADKYYAIIRRKERKSYVKNHISIDVPTRLILHFAAQRGPRFDTRFAIAAIRQIKHYKPKYTLADRAYDTEPIRKCINEEIKAQEQIPLKTRAKKGKYRLKSKTQFKQKIYTKRNNVESVFSVIKRIFNGTNRSRTQQLSNKETKLKNTLYNIYRSTQIQQK
ncbi:MAG: transposase [archaeon]|nr:transposase [archaeon]